MIEECLHRYVSLQKETKRCLFCRAVDVGVERICKQLQKCPSYAGTWPINGAVLLLASCDTYQAVRSTGVT